jgi:hypothetical protein
LRALETSKSALVAQMGLPLTTVGPSSLSRWLSLFVQALFT